MKPIGDLLREMQKKNIHMAMVVDEYGGFMGIVTLEDILREIVGDIGDEFEVEEKQVEKQADGSFLVDAALEVEQFTQAFGFELPEGDFDTLGGFLSLARRAPAGRGRALHLQRLAVHRRTRRKGARIDRVRVVRLEDGRQGPRTAAETGAPSPPPGRTRRPRHGRWARLRASADREALTHRASMLESHISRIPCNSGTPNI